ncbi:hypothetical protein DPMN_084201 [Dreissena polymorpha]|uniref:Uncharacterized protein n=1 Tax=Dreissena polymorpha TaxID=45954 RepID=A0A9D3YAM7_DREPO|nr:hypothetical protein DPMN_084201 [Dreissena polymorpha]
MRAVLRGKKGQTHRAPRSVQRNSLAYLVVPPRSRRKKSLRIIRLPTDASSRVLWQ